MFMIPFMVYKILAKVHFRGVDLFCSRKFFCKKTKAWGKDVFLYKTYISKKKCLKDIYFYVYYLIIELIYI